MNDDRGPRERPRRDRLDERTLEALRAGDRGAVEAVLRLVAPHVYRLARGLLGPAHGELDDAVQESLIAIGRALPGFEGRSSIVRYAVRIAARHVLRAARRQVRRWEPVEAGLDAEEVVEPEALEAPPPLELAQRRDALLELLTELPPTLSEALVLRGFFGLSLEEVSEITGRPTNTIRSRVRLARAALRARLDASPELEALLRPDGH